MNNKRKPSKNKRNINQTSQTIFALTLKPNEKNFIFALKQQALTLSVS